MAFDWIAGTRSAALQKRHAQSNIDSRKQEVRDKAGLLLGFGHPKAEVVARIQRAVAWEYDGLELPAYYKQIKKLVDEVYKRSQSSAS